MKEVPTRSRSVRTRREHGYGKRVIPSSELSRLTMLTVSAHQGCHCMSAPSSSFKHPLRQFENSIGRPVALSSVNQRTINTSGVSAVAHASTLIYKVGGMDGWMDGWMDGCVGTWAQAWARAGHKRWARAGRVRGACGARVGPATSRVREWVTRPRRSATRVRRKVAHHIDSPASEERRILVLVSVTMAMDEVR